MHIGGFEFWLKLTILVRMYRQHTGNKTYKLNINYTNNIRPYGECSKVTCKLLIY